MPLPRCQSLAVIACRVLENEIAAQLAGATHVVRQEFFEIGLHDRPAVLRSRLGAALNRAEADPAVQAIVLVYGLCGRAVVELAPRRTPVVLPRAHDCITLFLGSKERYAACMQRAPGTYWYSPGWNRDRRAAGPDREATLRREYAARFEPEETEALLAMDRTSLGHFTQAAYTDLGSPGDAAHRNYAKHCAHALGWDFQHHPGDPRLLHDLLHGPWDDARFLVVRPGQQIAHSANTDIVRAVPRR